MSKRLFVGRLPWDFTNDQLIALFSPIGSVVKAEMVWDKKNNRTRGFGFVEYETDEMGQQAIEALNGHKLGDKEIFVTPRRDEPTRSKPDFSSPRPFKARRPFDREGSPRRFDSRGPRRFGDDRPPRRFGPPREDGRSFGGPREGGDRPRRFGPPREGGAGPRRFGPPREGGAGPRRFGPPRDRKSFGPPRDRGSFKRPGGRPAGRGPKRGPTPRSGPRE